MTLGGILVEIFLNTILRLNLTTPVLIWDPEDSQTPHLSAPCLPRGMPSWIANIHVFLMRPSSESDPGPDLPKSPPGGQGDLSGDDPARAILASARPQPEAATPDGQSCPRKIESSQIFCDRREVHIVHCGEVYRLTITRNNKLILQK